MWVIWIIWKIIIALFLLFITYKICRLIIGYLHKNINIYEEKNHSFVVKQKTPQPIAVNTFQSENNKIIIPALDKYWALLRQLENLWWREFEFFVSEAFKKKWYNSKIWPGRGDDWIDVWAWKKNETILIQCKKWKSNGVYIWVKEVREFFGVISSYKWSKGIYITTTGVTESAREFIKKNNIEVWSKNNLEEKIREIYKPWDVIPIQLQNSDKKMSQQRFCIECGCEMIIKTAKRWDNPWKQFYWCTGYPDCRRTEEI
jgi:ssDNA-binding Zn-finger/Zn-ribbon topoisomerase 1